MCVRFIKNKIIEAAESKSFLKDSKKIDRLFEKQTQDARKEIILCIGKPIAVKEKHINALREGIEFSH